MWNTHGKHFENGFVHAKNNNKNPHARRWSGYYIVRLSVESKPVDTPATFAIYIATLWYQAILGNTFQLLVGLLFFAYKTKLV